MRASETADVAANTATVASKFDASKSDPAAQAPLSRWTYTSDPDEISGKEIKFASVKSTNTFEFGFPYSEPQRATLMLRQHPRWGKSAILSVERGQFLCRSDCMVTMRFDENSPSRYSVNEPQDASTTVLFVENFPRFLTNLRKAKQLRIEAQFYQEGVRVLEFDIAGMKWDLSALEKNDLAAAEADMILGSATRAARARCEAKAQDAVDTLNCEIEIGDCLRGSGSASARARCLSSVPATQQP